jgi:hypothetical protein
MNESTAPNSNYNFAAPKVRSLFWRDLPRCAVLIVSEASSADRAIVMVGGCEQLRLLLFRESLRGYVDVMVERGTVPSDQALLAMGRTIIAHLAAVPEWRDAP